MKMKTLRTLGAAALLAVGAVMTAGTAQADTNDAHYLAALAGLGINTTPADQLITAGHTLCDGGMENALQQFATQGQLLAAGVSYGQINPSEVAAARAYCPDKLRALGMS